MANGVRNLLFRAAFILFRFIIIFSNCDFPSFETITYTFNTLLFTVVFVSIGDHFWTLLSFCEKYGFPSYLVSYNRKINNIIGYTKF